jgi:FKBP-type peptidyl-prolyl cis-trans isomerase
MVNMKNKKLVITLTTIAVIFLAAAAYFIFFNKSKAVLKGSDASASSSADTKSSSGSDTLGVSNSDNMGQLQNSSGEKASNENTSQSGGGSSSSNEVDPSNFSQYAKYATSTTAEFGDIKVGTGAAVASGQTANITFKGWLTNGDLFGESSTNSDGQAEPLSVTLGGNQIIPGMQEGVEGMKVGGTRLIIIPPSLGYGDTAKGTIPANSVLIFEVTLISAQ